MIFHIGRARFVAVCAGAALAVWGCSRPAQATAAAPSAAAGAPASAPAPRTVTDAGAVEVSDALKVKRPSGGEYLGLYLLGKKVGYSFSDVVADAAGQARSIQEVKFTLSVGGKTVERSYRDVRVYESKPGGRLVSFVIEQKGDGGDQRLEGTATPQGIRVKRQRPGAADETLNLPAVDERIEDADPVRVALYRGRKHQGQVMDPTDLTAYRVVTEPKPPEERTIAGVKVKLRRATSISDKEKVPMEAAVSEDGELVEVELGQTLKGRAEPESVAKRVDRAEVFGLTRVVLPREPPRSAQRVPGAMTLKLTGLPERFWRRSERQSYRKLGGDVVEMTLRAQPPSSKKVKRLPLADPAGGENLKSTLAVESSNPEIAALARRLTEGEADAYAAARKVTGWVNENLSKEYGASADRASDVLRQKRGDCTEHSLLSVALLRAAGIPAKRVDGLVYLRQGDGAPALYWHEWVEAYVGEWTQLDPTFGQPVADATHVALGEESNAEIVTLIGQLKVTDVR